MRLIKPEDVLFVNMSTNTNTTDSDHFLAKIMDLGLAKRKKMRLGLRGTTLYMAPECLI